VLQKKPASEFHAFGESFRRTTRVHRCSSCCPLQRTYIHRAVGLRRWNVGHLARLARLEK